MCRIPGGATVTLEAYASSEKPALSLAVSRTDVHPFSARMPFLWPWWAGALAAWNAACQATSGIGSNRSANRRDNLTASRGVVRYIQVIFYPITQGGQ